jgi:hypothetical protein
MSVGRDSSVDSLRGLRLGDRIPVEARFCACAQTGPRFNLLYYTLDTESFPRGNAAGAWRWPPTPSSAEVTERVELYLFSPLGCHGSFYRDLYFTFTFTLSMTSRVLILLASLIIFESFCDDGFEPDAVELLRGIILSWNWLVMCVSR